eukprot:TRINITY_DN5929_c0_g1_i1.p1 TRINITY_DN5929_c0_g1~~TRINITY_DN5929_c0_g1_i1.p1  ORF type:complete len:1192 (+),score=196.01 TRINITY_DN5929_c0_g1_i1:23-3577(+)
MKEEIKAGLKIQDDPVSAVPNQADIKDDPLEDQSILRQRKISPMAAFGTSMVLDQVLRGTEASSSTELADDPEAEEVVQVDAIGETSSVWTEELQKLLEEASAGPRHCLQQALEALERGHRILILGTNGIGKSFLLNSLLQATMESPVVYSSPVEKYEYEAFPFLRSKFGQMELKFFSNQENWVKDTEKQRLTPGLVNNIKPLSEYCVTGAIQSRSFSGFVAPVANSSSLGVTSFCQTHFHYGKRFHLAAVFYTKQQILNIIARYDAQKSVKSADQGVKAERKLAEIFIKDGALKPTPDPNSCFQKYAGKALVFGQPSMPANHDFFIEHKYLQAMLLWMTKKSAADDNIQYFVRELHVFLPSRLLKGKGWLVDAPGTNDVDPIRSEITRTALEEADTVLLLFRQGSDDATERLLFRSTFWQKVCRVNESASEERRLILVHCPESAPGGLQQLESAVNDPTCFVSTESLLEYRQEFLSRGEFPTDESEELLCRIKLLSVSPSLCLSSILNQSEQLRLRNVHGDKGVDEALKSTNFPSLLGLIEELSLDLAHGFIKKAIRMDGSVSPSPMTRTTLDPQLITPEVAKIICENAFRIKTLGFSKGRKRAPSEHFLSYIKTNFLSVFSDSSDHRLLRVEDVVQSHDILSAFLQYVPDRPLMQPKPPRKSKDSREYLEIPEGDYVNYFLKLTTGSDEILGTSTFPFLKVAQQVASDMYQERLSSITVALTQLLKNEVTELARWLMQRILLGTGLQENEFAPLAQKYVNAFVDDVTDMFFVAPEKKLQLILSVEDVLETSTKVLVSTTLLPSVSQAMLEAASKQNDTRASPRERWVAIRSALLEHLKSVVAPMLLQTWSDQLRLSVLAKGAHDFRETWQMSKSRLRHKIIELCEKVNTLVSFALATLSPVRVQPPGPASPFQRSASLSVTSKENITARLLKLLEPWSDQNSRSHRLGMQSLRWFNENANVFYHSALLSQASPYQFRVRGLDFSFISEGLAPATPSTKPALFWKAGVPLDPPASGKPGVELCMVLLKAMREKVTVQAAEQLLVLLERSLFHRYNTKKLRAEFAALYSIGLEKLLGSGWSGGYPQLLILLGAFARLFLTHTNILLGDDKTQKIQSYAVDLKDCSPLHSLWIAYCPGHSSSGFHNITPLFGPSVLPSFASCKYVLVFDSVAGFFRSFWKRWAQF